MSAFPTDALKRAARERGFQWVGVTPAVPSPTLNAYLRWIDAGMHGTMGYMARPDRVARRRDLGVIVPGVRSLVIVGVDYRTVSVPPDMLNDPSRGRFAAYAWGADYHDILTPRLGSLAVWLAEQAGSAEVSQRVYVDTGAILERSHAQQAGLGFIGKNTMLIHPRRGSGFFLGEILTSLTFDRYDVPHRETMCGTCTRCLVACPTDAFPRPYVLDARRCISALTIEHKGVIPPELRPQMGNWVYGCDVCQDVCPWERFATLTGEPAFYPPDEWRVAPPLVDLLALDDAQFNARYAGSTVLRIKRERLVRNACVAAGNSGDRALFDVVARLLADRSALVRAHAVWALGRIDRRAARDLLARHLPHEDAPDVLTEIEQVR